MNPAGAVDDYLGMLLSPMPAPVPPPQPAAAPAVETIAAPAPLAPSPAKPVAPKPAAPAPALAPAPPPAPAPATAQPLARSAAPRSLPPAGPGTGATPTGRLAALACAAPPPPQRRAADRLARWLRLRCGDQAYAIELLKIREVVLPSPLLAMRGAAPCLAGVMNLRGQVVPVVDLGLQLGGAAVIETPATRIVVLEDNGEVLGLRVTSVEDVVLVGDGQIEGTHTSRLAPVGDHRIRGIARLGGAVMLLLDAARLMAMPLVPPR